MKKGINTHFLVYQFSLVAILLASVPQGIAAKTVYDPFIENFQVGMHSDPAELELAWGFPSGLLTPASIDKAWTDAGVEILSQTPTSQSPHLCLRLLHAMGDPEAALSWTKWHRLRIEQLISWPDSLSSGGQYLLAERLTMGFFRYTANGNLDAARLLARRLKTQGKSLGLNSREIFVWDLRARLLGKILKDQANPDPIFWKSILGLGSYDLGNAWAIWTAHRQLNGFAALPHTLNSFDDARKLSSLRTSWLNAKDINTSAFSREIKAGLGAMLLNKQNLNDHLAEYSAPPSEFTLQGWWVSGQRTSRRGQSGFYESLGRNGDIKPGWQLDLFRRASEIHLLNGRWDQGLVDLEYSLEKAKNGAGSSGQRRRLRQWAEQALVLALAQGDTLKAQKIHNLTVSNLSGDQLDAFFDETRHWGVEIGIPLSNMDSPNDFISNIKLAVDMGSVSQLKPFEETQKNAFAEATSTPLWRLWARWGIALIPKADLAALEDYRAILEVILIKEAPEDQLNLVVRAVALQMKSRLDKDTLLRWALDKDIHHLSGGISLTAISPMSKLAKSKLNDPVALHALLGLALLADDLRGIVGVATPMAPTGLTKKEKLCFLYPLPSGGSIHAALKSAVSDPALLLAVARNESLFEPSVRSRAGALGWMQIMPFHFPDKGAARGADNWSCAAVSIAKGDALLEENRRRYNGNPYLTLAAYNAGPGAVARWQKQLGGNTRSDIFLAWIGYPETRHYVEKVLVDREIYNWIIRESRFTY